MVKRDAPIWVLGCMSGTSMDGIDAAMILTDGVQVFDKGPSGFEPYSEAERALIRQGLGLWPGDDPALLDKIETMIRTRHAALIGRFENAELVGFHGQTLSHAPRTRGTFQIGRGDLLARDIKRRVVWDFRSTDIANGGEGAPLVPFFHFACAQSIGATGPVAFVNIGGVANVSFVDPTATGPEALGALLAFDTGPGNAPLDDFVQARLGARCDKDGALAKLGSVDREVVAQVMAHPYFAKSPCKSLDRSDFADISTRVAEMSDADGAACLTAITAASIAAARAHFPRAPERWLICGGGRLNATLMAMLRAELDAPVSAVEEVGLDGDMLEAQAFAYLAARVAAGLPNTAPGTTGCDAPVVGGRVSG